MQVTSKLLDAERRRLEVLKREVNNNNITQCNGHDIGAIKPPVRRRKNTWGAFHLYIKVVKETVDGVR